MRAQIIRRRFFVAVEGESEQSLVKWLQTLSEETLHIHLDCVPLGGGGFKSMLPKAARLHNDRRRRMGAYEDRFLILDGDRAERDDWPIEKLRQEAVKHGLNLCVQNPNHEGLLLRMFEGMELEIPDAGSAMTKLRSRWANYNKPMNALALGWQFSLGDLLRVARADRDLAALLKGIGLMP